MPVHNEEVRQTFVSYVPYTAILDMVVLNGDVILLLKPELVSFINPKKHYAVSPGGITEIPTLG